MVGCSHSTISRANTGQTKLRDDLLEKIEAITKVTPIRWAKFRRDLRKWQAESNTPKRWKGRAC